MRRLSFRWTRIWRLTLLVLLVGCGGTSNGSSPIVQPTVKSTAQPVPQRPDASATSTLPQLSSPVAAPTTMSPDVAALENPLRRRDAPPQGIAEQLDFGSGGGGGFSCGRVPDDSLGLRLTIYKTEYEVAQGFSICFSGFVKDQPIDVEIQRPDGKVQHLQVPADPPFGPEALDWVTWPGDPLGTYQVRATQGNQQATGMFRLRSASQPQVVVFPVHGIPGTDFRIALAGYQPNQQVQIHLYQSKGPFEAMYLTSLPISVNDLGQAIYTFRTHPDDPAGFYYVLPDSVDRSRVFGLNQLILDRSSPQTMTPFTVGQKAATRPSEARDLWTAQSGGERVFARPKLYGGTIITILAIEEGAVQVRTEEGVEGWIHEQAADALTGDLTVQGERNRFSNGTRVQIIHPNGIPLRAEPLPDADMVLDQIAPGQQAIVQEVRGDWLQITLDDGTVGWARWYYDGALYIDRVL